MYGTIFEDFTIKYKVNSFPLCDEVIFFVSNVHFITTHHIDNERHNGFYLKWFVGFNEGLTRFIHRFL